MRRAAEARRRRRQEYSSPLRERQKAFTHDLVMRSVSELVGEGKILTFTAQDVADRAGVSYAAVYRHFPTRNALLEGLCEWVEEVQRLTAPRHPATIDDLPTWVEGLGPSILEENAALVQARFVASTLLDLRFRGSTRRDRMVEQLVREATPNLSEEDRRRAFAVIRLLAGSETWLAMRRRFGLDSQQAVQAIVWSLRTVIEDLKERNARSRSRRSRGHPGGIR